MRYFSSFAILFVCCAFAPSFLSAQNITTPAAGSPERKDLLNSLRPRIEQEIGIEIIFEVRTLNVLGDWAFGELVPRQKNGQPIDYSSTNLAADQDTFDDWVCVLWQRGRLGWEVKTHILGATDVPYFCWWQEFGAPPTVLPYAESAENCR